MKQRILQTRINIEGPTWLCGDIHAEQGEFFHNVAVKDIRNSNIILLGDVGVGFWSITNPESFFRFFSKQLKDRNNEAYLIRGNHDNPDFWLNKETREKVESKWDNIKLIDEDFITINGDVFYIMSGAVSIDRSIRKEDVSWWRNERVGFRIPEDVCATYEDMCDKEYVTKYLNLENEGGDFEQVRGILSHTGIRPSTLDEGQLRRRCEVDKRLIDDVNEETEIINNVIQGVIDLNDYISNVTRKPAILPIWHFFGHYHVSWENTNSVVCKKCLNIHELYQLYN